MDISSKVSIAHVVKQILKKYGRLDILVNNAGINKPTDFDKITEKDWDVVLNTNLKGSFMLSKAIFPIMKKQIHNQKTRKVSLITHDQWKASKLGLWLKSGKVS